MKTEYITNNIKIIARTIREHAVTADQNTEGYLISLNNRILCSAYSTDYDLIVFYRTNGDPVALLEGEEQNFIENISDFRGEVPDIMTGISRLIELASTIKHDDEDPDSADWIKERIKWAEMGV